MINIPTDRKNKNFYWSQRRAASVVIPAAILATITGNAICKGGTAMLSAKSLSNNPKWSHAQPVYDDGINKGIGSPRTAGGFWRMTSHRAKSVAAVSRNSYHRAPR